jgi:hypothetical protein
VVRLVSSTVVPATVEPDGSDTVPNRLPNVVCALTDETANKAKIAACKGYRLCCLRYMEEPPENQSFRAHTLSSRFAADNRCCRGPPLRLELFYHK